MKILSTLCLAALIAGPALAQTPPASSPSRPAGASLTDALNGGPPAAAPRPAPSAPAPRPAAAIVAPSATPATERPTPALAPTSNRVSGPANVAPATATTPPRSAPVAPPAARPATTAPAAMPGPTPAPASPAAAVLTPAAVAALPFTATLPAGFSIIAGRPGPDFNIYTVRRGQQGFVTVYAGPASQFPIYDGETRKAGGRTSVVVLEGEARHAMEHLFERATAPREIHVWVASLDGADRALAERIAQSIDVKP